LQNLGVIKTVIHFQKDEPVEYIEKIEETGNTLQLETGAFLAAKWIKE